jgi:TRAP-type C4-dicarboxylate transport system permease large subunit
MGCVDGISMMLLTLPVLYPIIADCGLDPVFGEFLKEIGYNSK